MDILDKIREFMDMYGLNKAQLAKRAGLSPSTINSMFKRNTVPSQPTLAAIGVVFDVTPGYFYTRRETPPDSPADTDRILIRWRRLTDNQRDMLVRIIDSAFFCDQDGGEAIW